MTGLQQQGSHQLRRPTVGRVLKAGLFAALALGTLAVAGCDRSGPLQTNASAWEWRGDLAAPGMVNIRNTVGAITVEPSPDNQIHVVAATQWSKGDWRKDVDFQVVSKQNSVTICAVWGRGECSADNYGSRVKRGAFHSDAKVAFTVQVPAGVQVDAWTVSGDVTARASAPVKARTIDGDIRVGTAVGPVSAETVNGDVDIRMTTIGGAGDVRAVTKNGDAVAWVPEVTDGRIEATTMNGRVGSDFGGLSENTRSESRSFGTSIGAGSRAYEVQSLNGSAWLRLINPDGSVGPAGAAAAGTTSGKSAIAVIQPKRVAR